MPTGGQAMIRFGDNEALKDRLAGKGEAIADLAWI
jgi:glucose-6-phosphate dehydrogenase assembly protein OpcA